MAGFFKRGFMAVLVLGLTASVGSAYGASLRDHREINNGLAILSAGDMIQKYCPRIEPRMVRAYFFAKSLESMALKAGFSDKEIEDFVEDKAEKARVAGLATAYLVSKGLDPARPETYCTVGMYEIDRNSQIGVLLKAK